MTVKVATRSLATPDTELGRPLSCVPTQHKARNRRNVRLRGAHNARPDRHCFYPCIKCNSAAISIQVLLQVHKKVLLQLQVLVLDQFYFYFKLDFKLMKIGPPLVSCIQKVGPTFRCVRCVALDGD